MDNKIIIEKAQEITIKEMARFIADKDLDELMGLYGDIRVELSQKTPDYETPMIDAYTDLLAKEQKLCSPAIAYEAGREAAQSGRVHNPMEYLSKIGLSPENQKFYTELDAMFRNLCNLLGDTSGLANEYTEQYRKFYGTINRKIHHFYSWGYCGEMPDFYEIAE